MIDGERVELQLFTTLNCNMSCKYCSEGVGNIRNSQSEIKYNLNQLEEFVDTHFKDKEIIVTFYGGEPLLNMDYMKDVVERFPLWRYQLQTNATLLSRLDMSILTRLDNILISIDGDQDSTDEYRGKGTYQRVISNVEKIKYHTDSYLTARSTWATPKAENILLLEHLFDYVYFQFPHTEWVYTEQYIRDLKLALDELVEKFFLAGYLNIIPLMAFARNILFPSRAKELYSGKTQCRASSHLVNILPDGTITSCPDYAYKKKMTHGSVIKNEFQKSPLQYSDVFPCKECRAYDVCRINCVKGFHQCYIETDEHYKETVLDISCLMIQHLYDVFTSRDLAKWWDNLPLLDRREILNCPIYEYVEVMP